MGCWWHDVLVLVEHEAARPTTSRCQATALARGYAEAAGAALEAVLIGPGAADAAAGLGELGVAKAHVAEHEGARRARAAGLGARDRASWSRGFRPPR